jgi:hypothetical protein
VTNPSVSELKATPSTVGALSPESTVAGVAVPKMVQGHVGDVALGATGFDGDESGPAPIALVALTLKV